MSNIYYSEKLDQTFKVGDGIVTFQDGTVYSFEEVKLIKSQNLSSESLKELHEMKQAVNGEVVRN